MPLSVVQYVSSLPSTVLPGLKAVSPPRTLDALTSAPLAAAMLVLNVSLMLFPNSSSLLRIASSTVPWLFGGIFRSSGELCPTELKYIFARLSSDFGAAFVVPQNQPDVMRASASGTVHWLPSSNPTVTFVPFSVI